MYKFTKLLSLACRNFEKDFVLASNTVRLFSKLEWFAVKTASTFILLEGERKQNRWSVAHQPTRHRRMILTLKTMQMSCSVEQVCSSSKLFNCKPLALLLVAMRWNCCQVTILKWTPSNYCHIPFLLYHSMERLIISKSNVTSNIWQWGGDKKRKRKRSWTISAYLWKYLKGNNMPFTNNFHCFIPLTYHLLAFLFCVALHFQLYFLAFLPKFNKCVLRYKVIKR